MSSELRACIISVVLSLTEIKHYSLSTDRQVWTGKLFAETSAGFLVYEIHEFRAVQFTRVLA